MYLCMYVCVWVSILCIYVAYPRLLCIRHSHQPYLPAYLPTYLPTQASTAVDFFIRNRGGIIERSLRLLEAGGDTLSYVTMLSERFFTLLTDACAAFDSLFADQVGGLCSLFSLYLSLCVCYRCGIVCSLLNIIVIMPSLSYFRPLSRHPYIHTYSTYIPQPAKARMNECFARLVLWVDGEVRRYAALVGK